MENDYNKPSEVLVYDLIVYANGTAVPQSDLVFGLPEAFVPYASDPLRRDTRVTVSALLYPFARQRGKVVLTYRRLALEQFIPEFEDVPIEVLRLPFTAHQVLPQINARYGLSLSVMDIEDTLFSEASTTYGIKARAESLAWQGVLEIETTYIETRLDELIRVTSLDGFHYVNYQGDLSDLIVETQLSGFDAA